MNSSMRYFWGRGIGCAFRMKQPNSHYENEDFNLRSFFERDARRHGAKKHDDPSGAGSGKQLN